MLFNVIERVAADTGMDVVQQRTVLVRLFNAATKELHFKLECNKIFREVSLIVPPNKVISLPAYIGEIRGLRIHTNEMLFDLKSMMVPRYVNTTLQYRIKCWRDLGESPLHTNLSVVGPLTLNCPIIDTPPAVVIITGQTDKASRHEERGTISSPSLQTNSMFGLNIYNIASFSVRSADIQILDDNGIEVAILYNKYNKSRYKLIDVSQVFWPQSDTVGGDSVIDCCYKLPFIPCNNDSDSFTAGDDYDDAIYYMMMYLYYLPMSGKEQDAATCQAQAITALKSIKDGEEEGITKKLNFGRGKYLDIFRRMRKYGGLTSDSYGVDAGYAWPYLDY